MTQLNQRPDETAIEAGKRQAGYQACEGLKDGMRIGLGTGSTAYYAIERVGQLVAEGLHLEAVATSVETEELARARQIPLLTVDQVSSLDRVIDGVDEIDAQFNAIKGGGGALFREKVVASLGREVIWVMDDRKPVEQLGAFPLPLEVLPYALRPILEQLEALGLCPRIRCRKQAWLPGWSTQRDQRPSLETQIRALQSETDRTHFWITDNGNALIDLCCGAPLDPLYLEKTLRPLVGIVETGLFLNLCDRIVIGSPTGVVTRINPHCSRSPR